MVMQRNKPPSKNNKNGTYKGKSYVTDLKVIRQRQGEQTRPLKKKRDRDLSLIILCAQQQSVPVSRQSGRSSRGFFSRQQMVGLCFLWLIVSAGATDTNTNKQGRNKKSYAPAEKMALKQQVVNDICTDKVFPTFNKPNITLGMRDGVIIPNACLNDSSLMCKPHLTAWKGFSRTETGLDNKRDEVEKEYTAWENSIALNSMLIQMSLDESQATVFKTIIETISLLRIERTRHITFQALNGGNCGEHTGHALIKLMNRKFQYGLTLKIQTLYVSTSLNKNNINDHYFLLLDSQHDKNIVIKDNAGQVAILLNNLQGKICDPWNHGYYVDAKTDNSGFYNSEAKWDSVTLQTYSLDFSEFKALPLAAQKFLCEQLKLIGLSIDPRESCRIFKQNKNSNSQSEAKQNQDSLKHEF